MDTRIVYLAKDNADVVCHCACPHALIAYPGQMDCPWCGCGWLFTCIDCRKAFTFARGVEVDLSWEEVARHDLIKLGIPEPSAAHIRDHAEDIEALLAGVKVGQRYVYLDGVIIPADAAAVHFTGRHTRHDLEFVPHVKAQDDYSILTEVLGNRRYWDENTDSRS
jgi:hypothetical protein